jgi:tetratricopeptide (TPR) repeat protein
VVARTGLGEVLKAQGRLADAEAIYRDTVQRFPKDVVARNGLGEVLKVQGRLADAESIYRDTVQRFPEDVVARNGLGEVLKAQERLDEAEATYRDTVHRFPQDVFARTGLGEVLKAQGRLDDAEAIYRDTVHRFPEDVVARTGLGEMLKAQGQLADAETIYRDTIQRFPENVVARTGLGEVLKSEGRLTEAREIYEEAVERFPQAEVARSGLERISKVQERKPGVEPPVPPQPPHDLDSSSRAESRPAKSETLLDGRDLEILLQDVYLLRRWALRSSRIAATPGDLRESARQMLKPLLRAENAPPEAVREYGLLSLDSKDLEEVISLLRDVAKRYPGSARVRYTLACVEREAAARKGTLDRANPEAPVLSWRRLARLDERFVPLQLLGEARTWLVQTDGSLVAEKARDCLGQLDHRIQRLRHAGETEAGRDSRGFIPWWTKEIQQHVFGTTEPAGVEALELEVIQSNLKIHAGVLNRLEEDWLQHWARA